MSWGTEYRRFDQLTIDDEVLSRDEYNPNGEMKWKKVEELFVRNTSIWDLQVGGRKIQTSAQHPFHEYTRGWIAANELQPGNLIATLDGSWIPVERIEETKEYDLVYNCRVQDWHTYFIGGNNWGFAVWVHNTYTNSAMRRAVNRTDANGYRWYRDPYTNQMKHTRIKLAPDHILASQKIRQLEGFDLLSPKQQKSLFTDMKNIQALPYKLNSSKGKKSASEWTSALGREIDPGYTARLREEVRPSG